MLIDVLSTLGYSVSYYHVLNFEQSTTVHTSLDGLPGGLAKQGDDERFCQWVRDKFDNNEYIVIWHDTTHVIEIIACQVAASPKLDTLNIPRKEISTADVLKSGKFSDMLKPYSNPVEGKIMDVKFKPLSPVIISKVDKYSRIDYLWLISTQLNIEVKVVPHYQTS